MLGGSGYALRRTWRELESVVGFTWLDKAADYRGAIVDGSFYTLNYARQRLTAALDGGRRSYEVSHVLLDGSPLHLRVEIAAIGDLHGHAPALEALLAQFMKHKK